MKTLVLVTTFFFGMAVQAADVDQNNISNHQLSRRPYHEVPNENKNVNFEGAVLVIEKVEEDPKHKPMRLHMLGRQPYAVKNTD